MVTARDIRIVDIGVPDLMGLDSLATVSQALFIGDCGPDAQDVLVSLTDNPMLPAQHVDDILAAVPDADATVCGNDGEPLCRDCPPQPE